MSRMSEQLGSTMWNSMQAIDKLTRRTDPETSRLAANWVFNSLTEIQEKVLVFIKANPNGVTDLQISQHFEDDGSTYRTRRAELVAQGRVKNSGRRIKQDGTTRIVWEYVV